MYIGRWQKPPLWLALLFLFLAFDMMAGAYFSLPALTNRSYVCSVINCDAAFPTRNEVLFGGYLSWLFGTVAYAASGLWMLRTRWRLQHLHSGEELRKRFRLHEDEFMMAAQQRDVQPHININGVDYYSLRDWGDVSTLLRASEQPTVASGTLLRAASVTHAAEMEQLLRASQQ